MWDLPKSGVDPVSFALQGSFLTTNHQGNHMFFSSNHTQHFWHQKCDFFFSQQPGLCDTTWVSFWHELHLVQTPQVKSSVPQDWLPLQRPVAKSGSPFPTSSVRFGCKSVSSDHPPWIWSFARSVPRSQGSAYLTSLLYCKGNAKGNRWTFRWRGTERLGRVFEHRSLYPCRAGTCHPPGTWMCSLAGKNSKSWT